MGKTTKRLIEMLMQEMRAARDPKNNLAQYTLTQKALEASRFLEGGDYRQPPKGMFFSFDTPAEQMKEYQRLTNVGKTGTFGLADSNGGRSKATEQAGQYMQDRFARDTMANYQDNLRQASGNIQTALAQASGAHFANQNHIMSSVLGGLNSSALNRPSMWGQILGAAGSLGSAAISKF